MRTSNGAELEARELDAFAGLQNNPLHLALDILEPEAREHRAHQDPGSLLEIFGTRDYDRMFARALPHVFEEQEWQSAEMVAMQVTYDDRIERVGLDAVALHLSQNARARFQ